MKKQPVETLPTAIKLADLAEWSGFSERHLRDLAEAGNLPPITGGQLSFGAVPMLFKYLRRDSEELIREKLRRATADRRIAEVEAHTVEGSFMAKEIFNARLIGYGAAINNAINSGERMIKKSTLEEVLKANGQSAELMTDAVIRGVQAGVDMMKADAERELMAAADASAQAEESAKAGKV